MVGLFRYLSVLSNIGSRISFLLLICCLALNSLSFMLLIGAIASSLGSSIYSLYKAINIVLSRVTIPIVNLVTMSLSLSASNAIP